MEGTESEQQPDIVEHSDLIAVACPEWRGLKVTAWIAVRAS